MNMNQIVNLSYRLNLGQKQYLIEIFNDETQSGLTIELPAGKWDRGVIVNLLVRSKYPQDSVEALVNNHLLAMAEWQDKIFAGENPGKFEDPEYDKLQHWRVESKALADEIIKLIEKTKIE